MSGEEKTLSSNPVFEGRILKLRVDRVLLPDGKESTREIVEHDGAAAVVAVDEKNNIHLVRQFRKPLEKTIMEIPAGILYPLEEPLSCAQRELEEEVGLKAKQWNKLLSYYSAPGFCDEIIHIFLARELYEGTTNLDEDEFLEHICLPLEEAYGKVVAGEIVDGKSIIGIQMAYDRLMRQKLE